jgi:ABC-type transport system involved in multi-copper enzyme maturation permease subunit
MKSLFWKEWREGRVNLLVSVLIVAVLSLVTLFFDMAPGATFVSYAILVLAGFFGAWSFSNEKGTLEFLLSVPVARKTIFWDKWLIGILNILVLLVVALAIEVMIYQTNGFGRLISPIKGANFDFHGGPLPSYLAIVCKMLAGSFIGAVALYNVTFLMSIVFDNALTAFLWGGISTVATGLVAWGIFGFVLHLQPTTISAVTWPVIILGAFFLAYRIFSRKEVGA